MTNERSIAELPKSDRFAADRFAADRFAADRFAAVRASTAHPAVRWADKSFDQRVFDQRVFDQLADPDPGDVSAAVLSGPWRMPGTVSRRTVLRRRRIAVALGVGLLTLTGVGVASASVGRSGHSATAVHVVLPGESLWSIARDAKPSGDIRPLVARLGRQLAGGLLQPGDELIVPAP